MLGSGCRPVVVDEEQQWRQAELVAKMVGDAHGDLGDVIDEAPQRPQSAELDREAVAVRVVAAGAPSSPSGAASSRCR